MIERISSELLSQLKAVEPSVGYRIEYRPCRVRTHDHRWIDHVCFVRADQFSTIWKGPEGRENLLPIQDVAHIQEDPSRLPAALATRLYQAGESGMGYTMFTVEFASGRRAPFVTGNIVDFPNWPQWAATDTIIAIHPHEGRDIFRTRDPNADETGAPFWWCLYRE